MKLLSLALVLALGAAARAQTVKSCPSGETDVCYSVNVPDVSASSGSGDIYFQITGPSSKQWLGFGQGSSMEGANIFIVYADSSGTNVTLSPRLGKGEVQPLLNSAAQVYLLDGSGIANGSMTANVRCASCASWSGGSMNFTDSSSSWIWAVKDGSAIDSDSTSANLNQHTDMGSFTLDLTQARGGSSLNPFVASDATTSAATSSGSTSTATSSSVPSSGANSDSDDSGGDGDVALQNRATVAHGVMMALAFVIFFPLGAVIVRLFSLPIWAHAGVQIFAYTMALAAFGLGVWIASTTSQLNNAHPVIGIIVIALLFFQPFLGIIHHNIFRRTQRRTVWVQGHIWLGRVLITLGIINGGLGLQLSANTTGGEIAYGVIAGLVWVAYMAVVVLSAVKGKEKGHKGDHIAMDGGPVSKESTAEVRPL